MPKILIINTTPDKGGAARVALDLFKNLSGEFEMYFAYGRGGYVKSINYFKFGNKIEFLLHVFLVRFLGLEGFGTYFSTKKLIRYIKAKKFDLIHLHNLHGYYLNFFKLIKFLQAEGISVIWTLHDEWSTTWLPAYSSNSENKFSLKKINVLDIYPKNYFPFFRGFMEKNKDNIFTNNWSPLLVCPSEWLKSKISTSRLKKYKIEVIHNGIDVDIFKPLNDKNKLRLKYNLPLNKKIVFFAAANFNDKRKGVDDIISAAKRLNGECLFVGVGSGIIEPVDNIINLGYISEKDRLADLYNLSDLFCFASSAETFLLTVAESLSCGTPVVGYRIPVVSEIFKNEIGLLVDFGNTDDFAKSIKDLLFNDQLRLEMGKNGRKLILENYSQEIFYKKYKDLYKSTLNK